MQRNFVSTMQNGLFCNTSVVFKGTNKVNFMYLIKAHLKIRY